MTVTANATGPIDGLTRLLPRCACDQVAAEFLNELQLRGFARNSVLAYGRAVESLIAFADGNPLADLRLDRPAVYRFIAHLIRTPSRKPGSSRGTVLSRATVLQRISGLRAFADHLVDHGRLERNPVPRGHVVRSGSGEVLAVLRRGPVPRSVGAAEGRRGGLLPHLLSEPDWARLVEAVARGPDGARDRLMFALSYDGALRRGELTSLALDDFDFSARMIHLRAENTKGGTARSVVYSEATGEILRMWLAERRVLRPVSRALFISQSRRNYAGPLGANTWARVAARIGVAAGVTGFTPHALRHLRLTDLARAGLDAKLIGAYAGHRSVQTTMLYIHLGAADVAHAFRRVSARLETRTAGLIGSDPVAGQVA